MAPLRSNKFLLISSLLICNMICFWYLEQVWVLTFVLAGKLVLSRFRPWPKFLNWSAAGSLGTAPALGKAHRSAQESEKPFKGGFWKHGHCTPDCLQGCLLSLISDPLCASFECLACSGNTASALPWAPEKNHWHSKHTTVAWMARFTWCQWAGPNTDLACSKGWG